jgi:Flp pilus assembly CpaE family ATPase
MAFQFATCRDIRANNLCAHDSGIEIARTPTMSADLSSTNCGGHDTRISRSEAVSRADKLIIVNGAKGVVGTTAVNLAVQLGPLTGKRIALLEFARPFGQTSLMLDLSPRFTRLDALERVNRLDVALLASMLTRHKSGIEILTGNSHAAMRAEQRQSITIETLLRVLELACEAFDMVVVDLGFVNAAEWAAILKMADTFLLVTELAMGMLNRYLDAVDSSGIDRTHFQIGINRALRSEEDSVASSDKNPKPTFFARLPNDFRQVSEAVTLGIPLLTGSKSTLLGHYRDMAPRLLAQPLKSEIVSADSPAGSRANNTVAVAAK